MAYIWKAVRFFKLDKESGNFYTPMLFCIFSISKFGIFPIFSGRYVMLWFDYMTSYFRFEH